MIKQETIGIILGSICFLPVFLSIVVFMGMSLSIGAILLIVTQSLWLLSITLCTQALEIKNRQLRKRIKELEELNVKKA